MPINKGLGGFCFLKSVKDEILHDITNIFQVKEKESFFGSCNYSQVLTKKG